MKILLIYVQGFIIPHLVQFLFFREINKLDFSEFLGPFAGGILNYYF